MGAEVYVGERGDGRNLLSGKRKYSSVCLCTWWRTNLTAFLSSLRMCLWLFSPDGGKDGGNRQALIPFGAVGNVTVNPYTSYLSHCTVYVSRSLCLYCVHGWQPKVVGTLVQCEVAVRGWVLFRRLSTLYTVSILVYLFTVPASVFVSLPL